MLENTCALMAGASILSKLSQPRMPPHSAPHLLPVAVAELVTPQNTANPAPNPSLCHSPLSFYLVFRRQCRKLDGNEPGNTDTIDGRNPAVHDAYQYINISYHYVVGIQGAGFMSSTELQPSADRKSSLVSCTRSCLRQAQSFSPTAGHLLLDVAGPADRPRPAPNIPKINMDNFSPAVTPSANTMN